jgi:hypothetical protein
MYIQKVHSYGKIYKDFIKESKLTSKNSRIKSNYDSFDEDEPIKQYIEKIRFSKKMKTIWPLKNYSFMD